MGVQNLVVADPEVFEAENINRVPGATTKTVGLSKIDCFIADARAIDPEISIRSYSEGVTAKNVGEFLDGVDLVVDETELTQLELGTMISDAAVVAGVPVVIVMNIGFAAQVTALSPEGPGFRQMMGISSSETLEEISRRSVDFARCIPYLPPYTDSDVLAAVIDGASLPSIVPGVNLAAALGASQCFLWLTRGIEAERPDPLMFPTVRYIDALTGESWAVRNVKLHYKLSLLRMKIRELRGGTPKLRYPVEIPT